MPFFSNHNTSVVSHACWRTRTVRRRAPSAQADRSHAADPPAPCKRKSARHQESPALQQREQTLESRGVELRRDLQATGLPQLQHERRRRDHRRRVHLDERGSQRGVAPSRLWLCGHTAGRLLADAIFPVLQRARVDAELDRELLGTQSAIAPTLDSFPPLRTPCPLPWLSMPCSYARQPISSVTRLTGRIQSISRAGGPGGSLSSSASIAWRSQTPRQISSTDLPEQNHRQKSRECDSP